MLCCLAKTSTLAINPLRNSNLGGLIMHLQGKTALITGASRGIGRAIALEFAQHGVQRVLLVARDHQRLVEVAAEVDAYGVEAVPIAVDLTNPIDVNIAIAQVWRNYGPIDLLINCAGVAHQSSFLQSRLSDVQEEISTNLVGLYTITRFVARRMVKQQTGAIVNVSSLATYSATKFAILGFTQALRGELAAHNIKVTALLPSLTDTDMARDLQWFRWVIPMTPQQVARALVDGLARDSPEILVGWQSHLAVWGNRLAPWFIEKVMRVAAPKSYSELREATATSR
jgi:3-oxoacyl-[acyl-carrier protein] reductase